MKMTKAQKGMKSFWKMVDFIVKPHKTASRQKKTKKSYSGKSASAYSANSQKNPPKKTTERASAYRETRAIIDDMLSSDFGSNTISPSLKGLTAPDFDLNTICNNNHHTFSLKVSAPMDIESINKALVSIHENLPILKSAYEYEKELSLLRPTTYKKHGFSKEPPTKEEALAILEEEATEIIHSVFFWTIKKKRRQYIEDNWSSKYRELKKAWENEKEEYDKNEDALANDYNTTSRAEFINRRSEIADYLYPTAETILQKANHLVKEMDLPFDISYSVILSEEHDMLSFDLDFPSIDVFPKNKIQVLANGSRSIKPKTEADKNHDYVFAVCGTAYRVAAEAFNTAACIQSVCIRGRSSRIDERANLVNYCLFSVVFDRTTFNGRVVGTVFSPHLSFAFFRHKIALTKGLKFKAINPDLLDDPIEG